MSGIQQAWDVESIAFTTFGLTGPIASHESQVLVWLLGRTTICVKHLGEEAAHAQFPVVQTVLRVQKSAGMGPWPLCAILKPIMSSSVCSLGM